MTNNQQGRCQHCRQLRPLHHHPGPLEVWGHDPDRAAWLCPRHWSARELACERGEDISIVRDLIVWPSDESRTRVHIPGGAA